MSELKNEEIRRVVETYAPERLSCFDALVSKPLTDPHRGAPMPWTNGMRSKIALHFWNDFNRERPN